MSSEKYIPSYKVSEVAVNLIAEISAAVERFDIEISGVKGVRLRKTNRIKTIHGSTAIEGNTLTEDQVTAVLEGKKVIAPQREIDEILCAAAAYEAIESIDPCKVKDLLKVHKLMMGGLVETAGAFRTGQVGIIDGAGNVIHMAPPAAQVPKLMKDLFKWLNESGAHPLVKSVVRVIIIHTKRNVHVLAAVLVRFRTTTVPGKLQLKGTLVVDHEGVGP